MREHFRGEKGECNFAPGPEIVADSSLEPCGLKTTAPLKCPYCGFKSTTVFQNATTETFYVGCPSCGARGPAGKNAQMARREWNDVASKVEFSLSIGNNSRYLRVSKNSGGYEVEIGNVADNGELKCLSENFMHSEIQELAEGLEDFLK